MRRACLVLVPLLVVVVVLLCLAGRVHAASSAPERQDGRGRQQQAEQQDRDMGGEPFGEGEEEEGHNDSSGTSGGDGAQGLPTFNLLHARSRAELEGEGYHCFPTGECIECTEEEMVGGVILVCLGVRCDDGRVCCSIPCLVCRTNRRRRTARRRSGGRK